MSYTTKELRNDSNQLIRDTKTINTVFKSRVLNEVTDGASASVATLGTIGFLNELSSRNSVSADIQEILDMGRVASSTATSAPTVSLANSTLIKQSAMGGLIGAGAFIAFDYLTASDDERSNMDTAHYINRGTQGFITGALLTGVVSILTK